MQLKVIIHRGKIRPRANLRQRKKLRNAIWVTYFDRKHNIISPKENFIEDFKSLYVIIKYKMHFIVTLITGYEF